MASAANGTSPSRGVLAYNASRIGMLQSCLSGLDSGLGTAPSLILSIDEGNCWRDFKFPDAPEVHWGAAQFREFIEAPRPAGCETPLHVLEQALRGTEAWETFLRLTRGERGNPDHASQPRSDDGSFMRRNRDIVTVTAEPDTIPFSPPPRISQGNPKPERDYKREAPTGNSTSYGVRRLQKAAPLLYEKVKRGEMSAHAAGLQAGTVKPVIQIPHDPQRAARIIARHLNPEQGKALIVALSAAFGFKLETD